MYLLVPRPQHPHRIKDHPDPNHADQRVHQLQDRLEADLHHPPHGNSTSESATLPSKEQSAGEGRGKPSRTTGPSM